jgi:Carbon-nitrogen hydrolase
MTIVKAAAVQISPVLYSREGTVQKVIQKIAELARLRVQFATFPETVVPYYPYFSFVQTPFEIRTGKEHLRLLDQAVTVPSAPTEAIGEAARQARMVVSIGVNERDGGTLYNTQLLFDADGTLIQRRRRLSAISLPRLGDRESGDKVECAKSRDFRAFEAQVANRRQTQDWLAAMRGIANGRSNGPSWIFLAENPFKKVPWLFPERGGSSFVFPVHQRGDST